jgi:mono/diheme cytochrome c family protein
MPVLLLALLTLASTAAPLVATVIARAQEPASGQASGQQGTARSPAGKVNGDPIDGATLFATSCGWCHQGGGRVDGKGPKLAGTVESDEVLIRRIKVGKPGAMPAFGTTFSDPQIKAIVAYIRTLKD